MPRNYFYKHIEIFDLPYSAKLYFDFGGYFISVHRDYEIYFTEDCKSVNVNLSNLDSKLKEFLLKLECMYPDADEYANRELRIIYEAITNTICRFDFTCEMLNNISFHISPIKSARK